MKTEVEIKARIQALVAERREAVAHDADDYNIPEADSAIETLYWVLDSEQTQS